MNSRVLAAFAAGVVASATVFYVSTNRKPDAAPAPAAVVQVAGAPVVASAVAAPVAAPAVPETPKTPESVAPAKVEKPVTPKRQEQWRRAAAATAAPVAAQAAEAPAPASTVTPAPAAAPSAPASVAMVEESKPELKREAVRREAIPLTPSPSAPVPAVPESRKVTISGGTLLSVRIGEKLSSDKQKSGDPFRATLDQPLIVDGLVIAERGAPLEGRVVSANRDKDAARLELELIRFTSSDGQVVGIRTATFDQEGSGSNSAKSDVKKVAIGAAAGAILGGIFGGGKGAGIGAAAGGATGGGVALATRGKPAELAAETRLTFRLSEPVAITEKQD